MTGLRRLTAVVLSFLIPGAGQLYIGKIKSGLFLLAAAVTAAAAMIYYASASGGRHLLLIVYLGLSLPAVYFYSMLDILQSTSPSAAPHAAVTEREGRGLAARHGFGLIAAGALLLAFAHDSEPARIWLGALGDYAPMAGLLALGAILHVGRGRAMYRLGRTTAAIAIITVGALLLWDRLTERNDIALIGQWWPLALVLLGAEIVAISLAFRAEKRRVTFDFGGMSLAAIVTATAFAVTQFSGIPLKWIDQWNVADVADFGVFSEEQGERYEKPAVTAEWSGRVESLTVDNPNGHVTVREGDVERLVVDAVVWIDTVDKSEADRIAEKSAVEITGEEKLTIAVKGEPYGASGMRKPRFNLVVTLPRTPELPPAMAGSNGMTERDEPISGGGDAPDGGEGGESSGERAADGTDRTDGEGAAGGADGEGAAGGADGMSDAGIDGPAGDEPDMDEADGLPDGGGEGESFMDTTPDDPGTADPGWLKTIAVAAMNGNVELSGLHAAERVTVKNTDGEIEASDIEGSLSASTRNGAIAAFRIAGDVELTTVNGKITADDIDGEAIVSAVNGAIALSRVRGAAEADTKNGEITMTAMFASLHADTLNGPIRISSPVVGGSWDVGSAVGEIALELPENGDYSVRGSVTFGDIETDLPLEVGRKTVRGDIGEGTHRISVDANSSISINRFQQ